MDMPISGEDALEQLSQLKEDYQQAGPLSYEQAVRGLIESVERLSRIVATSQYFNDVVTMQQPCPDYKLDVPDALNSGRHVDISIPIGAVVRASAQTPEQAQQLLKAFFTIPQNWLVMEHNRCLENAQRYLTAIQDALTKPSAVN